MQLPTTSKEFVSLMERIWEAYECTSTTEGMNIQVSAALSEFGDARQVALACGMRQTGSSTRAGDPGYIYRFPNGDGVWIASDGGAVCGKVSKYGARGAAVNIAA